MFRQMVHNGIEYGLMPAGRWTIEAAIEEAVPVDVLAAPLFGRFRSRQPHTFAEEVLSAMRFKFGGHVEPAREKSA